MQSAFQTKISGWYKTYPVIFFVLSFALMMGVFYLFYFSVTVQLKVFPPLLSFYARLSSAALDVMGYRTTAAGSSISSSQFSVDVKAGCDAIEPMALFIAGVLAFPVRFGKKMWGLLAGILILFIINVIRIMTLFIAGVHSRALFETMHVVVWQLVFILLAVGLWVMWLRRAVSKKVKS